MNTNNRTVIVTGGLGYIGSHTVKQLRKAGFDIIVVDNLVYGHKEAIVDPEVKLVVGDLGDKVSVKAGYGRNFLIPFGKAVPATKDNLASFEARRAELEAAAAEKLSGAEARATSLQDLK